MMIMVKGAPSMTMIARMADTTMANPMGDDIRRQRRPQIILDLLQLCSACESL